MSDKQKTKQLPTTRLAYNLVGDNPTYGNLAIANDLGDRTTPEPSRSGIIGVGAALPKRQLTNEELSKYLDTNDEWIRERVGIRTRYIADDQETSVSLAEAASREALEMAGLTANDIDLIVFATVTPDRLLPSAAALLQNALGCKKAMSFDLQAACSGFLFSLATADGLQQAHGFRNALVVGSETLSKIVDWNDRNTCVLFGDGAGAVVYANAQNSEEDTTSPILGVELDTKAELCDLISRRGGAFPKNNLPSDLQGPDCGDGREESPYISMNGREVFKAAVGAMCSSIKKTLKKSGVSIEEIDHFVPHQSNKRMIDAVCERVKIKDYDKVILNIETIGNTSAASIPIALTEGVHSGRIKKGDLVLMTAVGAGITYGSMLLRW